ncbi:hypothetical protein [Mesorhizobium sp.]|uniref:hypothetical protein n=1 Tax=Mesorhizobium sp. TaxID=1871066 RepID=UPI00120842F0|nr:hypothetical protein [Mesorhizobium sp.]TIN24035.1 MAG: hypothetical protein E5Y19_24235 [Mesorhizobium sp.]
MASPTQTAAEIERQALEELRAQYTEKGFTFIAHPSPEQIPAFLGNYRPDAIARKPGTNVVIEVRQRPSPTKELSLQDIRRLFEGQSEWQFVISYGGSDSLTSGIIPAASQQAIRERMAEVRNLAALGQRRAAFVLAWSLLEASLIRVDKEQGRRPRTPGTVIQTLAMLGYISPEIEPKLRPLIAVRNRIVHGDVNLEPSVEDLETVLDAISQALS